MKITKTASGKTVVKMTKSEWKNIGKKAGWMRCSNNQDITIDVAIDALMKNLQPYGIKRVEDQDNTVVLQIPDPPFNMPITIRLYDNGVVDAFGKLVFQGKSGINTNIEMTPTWDTDLAKHRLNDTSIMALIVRIVDVLEKHKKLN